MYNRSTVIARQRRRALASPCLEAEECNNQAFFARLPRPLDHVSVGLTVNVGLE